jgi:cation transport ATPase
MFVALLWLTFHDSLSQICQAVSIALDDCHSRLLPQEKLDWIVSTQMENNNAGVVMLGDGINGLPPSVLPLNLFL